MQSRYATSHVPSTSYAPLQPTTFPNPLTPKPIGAGALTVGSAAAIGFALMAGGGIAGGLVGAKFGKRHQTGATIAGTLLGAIVIPMLVGPFIGAAAGGIAVPAATPAGG